MKTTILITSLLLASQASASWFSSNSEPDPAWKSWDETDLKEWLRENNIKVPQGYSQDQLAELVEANWYAGQAWTEQQVEAAKKTFQDAKDSTYDTWSDSQLRDFLVKQGVVQPQGTREQLVVAAQKQYRAYSSAASSLGAAATDAASTAYYGDKQHQATKTVSSISRAATSLASTASAAIESIVATNKVYAADKLDDTKDYVYSTWDDNQLRTYLEEKGVIKTNAEVTRDELLAKMQGAYASVADPVWKAWGDSYLWQWLHSRGLVRSDAEKKRDYLEGLAQQYYYSAQDTAYTQWTESELKQWLVDHNIVKSDAQIKKDKMQKLVADNYATAHDTVYGGWKDSDLRDWLISHGYLRSDAQVKRDELIKLMNQKYSDVSTTTASYLTWPDARLRAYLRANGLDESNLPTSRPGLLQEVRIRWVQSTNNVESTLQRLRDILSSTYDRAEEQLNAIIEAVTGYHYTAKNKAWETEKSAEKKAWQAEKNAEKKVGQAQKDAEKIASSVSAKGAAKTASVKNEL